MLRALVASVAFAVAIETTGRLAHRRLLAAAADPRAAQNRTLSRILDGLAATDLGRRYGYASLRDVDEFRRRVPIHDYEALRAHVERQIATGERTLAPTPPLMYARTSGTTGKPKLIPVTQESLRGLTDAQRAFSYVQHRALGAFRGRLLAIGGALREEVLRDGTPAGATTGLIYDTMPALIRAKYVVPAEVFAIEDYELRYSAIARLAVQHRSLSLIATANPSTILRLLGQIETELPELTADVASGGWRSLSRLPPDIRVRVRHALKASAAQAARLEAAGRAGTALTLGAIWPNLRAVMTWLGGGCAPAAASVRARLPPSARMIDAGYVASELRGTVVVDVERNLALPLLGDVFFEFAPVAAWEAGERATLLLHELTVGESYYVIVTTPAGLVRYDMNDVLRVSGTVGRTPTLEFVRKGRGVTSITGEKVTEDQVTTAVTGAAERAGVRVPFHVVAASAADAAYIAYLEPDGAAAPPTLALLATELDARLAALNIEYAAKRASGRLRPVRVVALRAGTGAAYREHCVRKGQREAQFKALTLQTAAELDFDFAPFATSHADAPASR